LAHFPVLIKVKQHTVVRPKLITEKTFSVETMSGGVASHEKGYGPLPGESIKRCSKDLYINEAPCASAKPDISTSQL
jgi:hypothetical protein